jgi:hypothetical protein
VPIGARHQGNLSTEESFAPRERHSSHVVTVEEHPAVGRSLDSSHQSQQGGLAGTPCTPHADEQTRVNIKGHAVKHNNLVMTVWVSLAYILKRE